MQKLTVFYVSISSLIIIGSLAVYILNRDRAIYSGMQQSTASPVTYPTQISEEDRLDIALDNLELDIHCKPICWGSFVIGQTPAPEIYKWFFDKFSDDEYITIPVKNSYNSPDNYIVGQENAIRLLAFSDNTQPEPQLRGYSIILNLRYFEENELSNQQIVLKNKFQHFFPQQLISNFGIPQSIHIGKGFIHDDSYTLFLNYDNFSVTYSSDYRHMDNSEDKNICPDNNTQSFVVLIFDGQEEFDKLLEDLDSYFEYDWLPHVIFARRFQPTRFNDKKIVQNIAQQLLDTGCIDTSSIELEANSE